MFNCFRNKTIPIDHCCKSKMAGNRPIDIANLPITNNDIFGSVNAGREELGIVNQITSGNTQEIRETRTMVNAVVGRISNLEYSVHRIHERLGNPLQNGIARQDDDKGCGIPREAIEFCLTSTKNEAIKHILESDDNILGEGGFGIVKRGKLNGQDVAVKKLTKSTERGKIFNSIF